MKNKQLNAYLVGIIVGCALTVSFSRCDWKYFKDTFWQTPKPFRFDGLTKFEGAEATFTDPKTKQVYNIDFYYGFKTIFDDGKACVSGTKTNWQWHDIEVHLPAAH